VRSAEGTSCLPRNYDYYWNKRIFITFEYGELELLHYWPRPVAAVEDVSLRPLACWDCGFGSRWGPGCPSVLCYSVRHRSLRRADHSSRGDLPSMVCLTV